MFGRSFNNGKRYCPIGFAKGDWAEETIETVGFQALSCTGSQNYTRDAKKVRDDFRDYFDGVGSVPWQWDLVSRTSDPFQA